MLAGALGAAHLSRAARRAGTAERTRRLVSTRGRMPARVRDPLTRALEAADVALEPEAAMQLWLAGMAAGAFAAFAIAPPLAVPGALAALGGPAVALRLARERRERKLTAALPGALERMAAELRGGGTVAGGLSALAATPDLLAPDLRRVCSRVELGSSLPDALSTWPAARPLPGVREATGALVVAATMGGRAAGALDALAASLRERLGVFADAKALSAQARLSAVVVGAAPLGYLVFSTAVDGRALSVLVGTGVGRVCLVVGLGLEVLAAWWMGRLVRIEV